MRPPGAPGHAPGLLSLLIVRYRSVMRTPAVGALAGQVAIWAVILGLVLVCSDSALADTSGAPQFATGQQTPSSPSAGKPDTQDPSVMPLPTPETAASGNHSWRQRG